MAKPYTGPQDETCPHYLGELCSKVCPTCKFQQPFTMQESGNIQWECSLLMHHVITLQGNANVRNVGAEVEALRNDVAKPQPLRIIAKAPLPQIGHE